MNPTHKIRTKRIRRTNKQVLRFGWSAKAKHKSRKGRTGDKRNK